MSSLGSIGAMSCNTYCSEGEKKAVEKMEDLKGPSNKDVAAFASA